MKVSPALSTAPIAAPAARRPAERFRLTGPSVRLDPRTHAVRPDIADISLADRVFAPHYAQPDVHCCRYSTMMREVGDGSARAVSQLIAGEAFAVIDISGDWAWGYSLHDHYVGHVPIAALGAKTDAVTHMVSVPLALVFAAPDIKSTLVGTLSVGARIDGEVDRGFVRTSGGYVHTRHLRLVEDVEEDPVAVAERLIGLPYLWGGRGAGGIDCSGLVQLALGLCGRSCPRDSDQQRLLGDEIEDGELRRGDLVFFPGHVGFMADGETLLHANAHWMAVVAEPLADVVARLLPNHDRPIVARRRIA